jgi:tetratricopeptide (TPR) repeat protein
MSVQIAASRFIVPPKAISDGLYQQLLKGVLSYEQLGNKLIHLCEWARTFRQFDMISEYAFILSKLPSRKYQAVGQYYSGLAICQNGLGEMDRAQAILEKAASVAPLKYRAQAMITLSAISWVKNQPSNTLEYCIEAARIGSDLTAMQALRGIAVLKGREGFHRSSLRDLENLYPIMKYTPPHIYFDYLNSYAVELVEAGKVEEAQNVCRITLASPYAFAYPEWRETEQDLALRGYKSRSSVRVKTIPGNLFYLPEREASDTPAIQQEDARVLSIQKWKEEKMVKEPNGNGEELPDDMSVQQMAMKIIELITNNKDDEDKLRDLLNQALKIYSKK